MLSSDLRWALESHSPPRSGLSRRTPFWLWPNLLSLDAVVVVIYWQSLFIKSVHAPAHYAASLVLALTVWLIYTADRLLDSAQLQYAPRTERHRFSLEHRRPLVAAFCLAAGLTAFLLPFLQTDVMVWGACLAAVVAIYFLVVHFSPPLLRRFWPKEYVVGLIFASGAALPAWAAAQSGRTQMLLPVLLFAGLCTLNCLSIEAREARPKLSPAIIPFALALLAASLFGAMAGALDVRPLFCALAVAFISLAYLQAHAASLPPSVFRVLADLALLSPPLVWFLL